MLGTGLGDGSAGDRTTSARVPSKADISFTAEMNGHVSPAGFLVLNGTVTEGSFAGAEVHQRSDLVGVDGTTTA